MRAMTDSGIEYDVERVNEMNANGWGPDMDDDRDVFLNGNDPNVHNIAGDDLEDRLANFAAQVEHDEEDDTGFPVYVYKREGKYVAWIDPENCWGYVAA